MISKVRLSHHIDVKEIIKQARKNIIELKLKGQQRSKDRVPTCKENRERN